MPRTYTIIWRLIPRGRSRWHYAALTRAVEIARADHDLTGDEATELLLVIKLVSAQRGVGEEAAAA